MIDTAARSAIAAAMASLVRRPGPMTTDVQGAAVVVVERRLLGETARVVDGLGQALDYETVHWKDEACPFFARSWPKMMATTVTDGGSTLLVVTAGATPFDVDGLGTALRQTLAAPGHNALVVVAERRGTETEALIEAICDIVTEASVAGSGRDGGVEVVDL